MPSESIVTSALRDLVRACGTTPWTIVGGQALIAHGVPRTSFHAVALVPLETLVAIATRLTESCGWLAMEYDGDRDTYVQSLKVKVGCVKDPVLAIFTEERSMVPLRSPLGLPVELLAVQHPIEFAMLNEAMPRSLYGVTVPIAPLGGVLLLKAKVNRPKDAAAIAESAEHLSGIAVSDAVQWARMRDPRTATRLATILHTVRTRKTPKRFSAFARRA